MENINQLKNFWSKKKVFITGHTGFKGSWLSIILTYLNSTVDGYALKPERNSLFNKSMVSKALKSNTYGDINDIKKLKNKIKKCRPEIVFHLAAQPLVLPSYKEPLKTFNTNIMGTLNLLESIRSVKSIKSVVIITTDKVYKISKNNKSYKLNAWQNK
jgi:CDP-glucose 4,6-dehydratase